MVIIELEEVNDLVVLLGALEIAKERNHEYGHEPLPAIERLSRQLYKALELEAARM